MSSRSGLVLILSLMFGGSAALGVNKYVRNRTGGGVAGVAVVPVVVATQAIPRGVSITPEMVRTRDYPKGLVLPGTLARLEDAIDRAVFVPMVKDELLLDGKLAPKGTKSGMAALVPNGLRAFTIHTPSVASGVAGFILPGNKVDVLWTMDGKQGSQTTTLLQNLEILAVDQRIDAPPDNRVDPKQLHSVTLLVTPDEAAKLGLAQSKGALQLALRNHKDDQLVRASRARLSELDDGPLKETPTTAPATPRDSPPAERGLTVTIYRGVHAAQRVRLGEAPAPPGDATAIREEPGPDAFR